jgi:hypothetical protein
MRAKKPLHPEPTEGRVEGSPASAAFVLAAATFVFFVISTEVEKSLAV